MTTITRSELKDLIRESIEEYNDSKYLREKYVNESVESLLEFDIKKSISNAIEKIKAALVKLIDKINGALDKCKDSKIKSGLQKLLYKARNALTKTKTVKEEKEVSVLQKVVDDIAEELKKILSFDGPKLVKTTSFDEFTGDDLDSYIQILLDVWNDTVTDFDIKDFNALSIAFEFVDDEFKEYAKDNNLSNLVKYKGNKVVALVLRDMTDRTYVAYAIARYSEMEQGLANRFKQYNGYIHWNNLDVYS